MAAAPFNDFFTFPQTALHYAVSNQHSAKLVPILIGAGAKVNVGRSVDKWTPLHLAAAFGNVPAARYTLLVQTLTLVRHQG